MRNLILRGKSRGRTHALKGRLIDGSGEAENNIRIDLEPGCSIQYIALYMLIALHRIQ